MDKWVNGNNRPIPRTTKSRGIERPDKIKTGEYVAMLAVTIGVANLYYVNRNADATANNLRIAGMQSDRQWHANLPRLTILAGDKHGSYKVRNIGTQPAWSITWATIRVDARGYAVGFDPLKEPPPKPRLLQPSGLAGRDEAVIDIQDEDMQNASNDKGIFGIYLSMYQIDVREHPVIHIFTVNRSDNYIAQTMTTDMAAPAIP